MPAGAWAGVNTTSADGRIAVGLRRAQLVAHLAAGHLPVLRLDHDAQLRAAAHVRIERQDEVALLRAPGIAGIRAAFARAGHSAPRAMSPSIASRRSSKSAPFAADLARSPAAGLLRGLEGHELVVERPEALGRPRPELVERRAHPGRVEELR